jgi:hypothetical protein
VKWRNAYSYHQRRNALAGMRYKPGMKEFEVMAKVKEVA